MTCGSVTSIQIRLSEASREIRSSSRMVTCNGSVTSIQIRLLI